MNETAKDKIASALISLLAYTAPEKITVKKLLETAGVNKSTYYYHFTQISDVVKYIKNIFLEEIEQIISITQDSASIDGDNELLLFNTTAMLEFIYEHKDTFAALLNSPLKNEFRDDLIQLFIRSASQYNFKIKSVKQDTENVSTPLSYSEKMYYTYQSAYSLYSTLECWTKRRFEETPENLAKQIVYFSTIRPQDVTIF